MAQVTAEIAGMQAFATRALEDETGKINLDQLSQNRVKMDGFKQQLGTAHELLCSANEADPTGTAADDMLAQLEMEINTEALVLMDSIPGSGNAAQVPGSAIRRTPS
jgi:hypothetical protein